MTEASLKTEAGTQKRPLCPRRGHYYNDEKDAHEGRAAVATCDDVVGVEERLVVVVAVVEEYTKQQ